MPVYAVILLAGCALAVLVLLTSKNEEPPKYHMVRNHDELVQVSCN